MPKTGKARPPGNVRPIAKPIPRKNVEDRPAIVDEYGRISQKLEGFRRLEKRQEQLRAKIQSWYGQAAAAEGFTAEGRDFALEIGPCSIRRMIPDLNALAECLGEQHFRAICTVSLEKLDCYLSLNDQKPFVVSDRTGPRSVKAIAKFDESLAAG